MTGESTTTTSVEPVDIVLVLDVSGSMDDPMYSAVYQLDKSSSYYVKKNNGTYTEVKYSNSEQSWGYETGLIFKYWVSFVPKTSASDTDSSHVQFYQGVKKMTALQT